MVKIITMDALCEYFAKKGKTIHFNSEEADHELFVRADGKMKFETLNDQGLLKVTLQSCHIGKNLNGSSISYEAMQDALPSFYSRPILGYIHEVDGQYEFKSHEMHVDGEGNLVYDEIPVGVITSKDGMIEHDYEKNKDYAVVSGVIWEEYTKAAEILKRDKKADCSVELKINDLSYDANEKLLLINSFVFTGVTILGKDKFGNEVEPGMEGANIAIDQFAGSAGESVPTEYSDNKKSEERRTTNMATKGLPEGEKNVAPEEIDQKTTFDDSVDGDGTSDASGDDNSAPDGVIDGEGAGSDVSNQNTVDPEPENNEGSVVENTEEPEQNTNDSGNDPVVEPEPEPVAADPVVDAAPLAAAPAAASSDTASENNEEGAAQGDDVKKRLLSIGDMSFELTLREKSWAVEDLVNATYSDADNDWYFCDVFENYVIMHPWMGSQLYRQNYVEEPEGVFSLTGEREKVFAEYLTEAERDALNMMRSTYAELKQYKEESEMAKIEAEKSELFASFDEKLAGVQEYEDLKSNRAKYAVSELELQCNAIVGKQTMKFAAEESTQKNTIQFNFSADRSKEKKPYGALFDKK